MVAISVRPKRSRRYIDDGDVVLTNGRAILLSSISGGSWSRPKLQRLTNAVQAEADTIQLISSLPADDPDRFEHEADPVNAAALLLAQYGGSTFYRGPNIVFRSVTISFSLVDGDLKPLIRRSDYVDV